MWGNVRLPLHEGENVLGRGPGVDVPVVHPSVSREHARITVRGDRVTVEDLGSKNGTFVRGVGIAGETPVRSGEEVSVGAIVLVYLDTRLALGGSTWTVQ